MHQNNVCKFAYSVNEEQLIQSLRVGSNLPTLFIQHDVTVDHTMLCFQIDTLWVGYLNVCVF